MKRLMMIMITVIGVFIAAGNVHAQAKGQPRGEKFVLTGVIHMEGGGGLAYLQEPTLTNNAIVAVRPGGQVGPYKLTKIFEDRVELEGPSGAIVVPLYGGSGSGTAVASKRGGNQTAKVPTDGDPSTPTDLQKIYAGNPNVHYYPVGSPGRNVGFGGIFSAIPGRTK